MSSFNTPEWVDRQPYYGEVVDQGLSKTKSGKVNLKIYYRVLGKVSNVFEPEKGFEEFTTPAEVEMVIWLEGDEKQLEFRIKDLQNMGFKGDDITVLDPRHPQHQSFVGNKYLLSPYIKEAADGTRKIYWNHLSKPGKKKFVRDVDLSEATSSLTGLSAQINKMLAKKEEKKVKEPAPF